MKMVTYFNRKDLVSFGSYLLSEERLQSKINSRDEMIRNKMHPPSLEEFTKVISHADVENWKETIKK